MRESVVTVLGFLPVFGFSIFGAIGGDNTPLELDGLNVEAIVVAQRAKPHILRVVLPVGLGTAPLFSFPCDPVADMEVLVQNGKNEIGRLPVATDVN